MGQLQQWVTLGWDLLSSLSRGVAAGKAIPTIHPGKVTVLHPGAGWK